MDQLVSLQTVGLRESRLANVTLVGFLAGVNAQMTFQLERVGAGVGTVRTLIGSLAGVTADMSLELGQLYRCVVALCAFVRLLVRVSVPNVSHQFTC